MPILDGSPSVQVSVPGSQVGVEAQSVLTVDAVHLCGVGLSLL